MTYVSSVNTADLAGGSARMTRTTEVCEQFANKKMLTQTSTGNSVNV